LTAASGFSGGLAAGGKGIRTLGPPYEGPPFKFAQQLAARNASAQHELVIAAATRSLILQGLNRKTEPIRPASGGIAPKKLLEIRTTPSSVPARKSRAPYRKAARNRRTLLPTCSDTLSSDNDPTSHQCNRCHETRTNQPTRRAPQAIGSLIPPDLCSAPILFLTGHRWFESLSLHQRVSCEPDFLEAASKAASSMEDLEHQLAGPVAR